MDEAYDAIVLGTGLTECIVSGLLSADGKRVLHIDRNDYYGGESASLSLEQIYERFGIKGDPEKYGKSRDYNIDLIPKFLMSQGKMVKMIIYSGITHNLDFKSVDGSFVIQSDKIHKVPSTEKEALASKLMGIFEKRRFASLLSYMYAYDEKDPKTTKGKDLKNMSTYDLLKSYKLDDKTMDFIGHALALYQDDSFLQAPASEFTERCNLYTESLNMSVNHYKGKSPYLYPLYGLGDLSQAFARLSAIHGGTYMMKQPLEEVLFEDNKVIGIKVGESETSPGGIAKAPVVIADPSYFEDRVKAVSQVVRCICLMDHPIPNTGGVEAAQLIIPQKQAGRKHDIYITMLSDAHFVVPKGYYLAILSTTVETDSPKSELDKGLALLGPVLEKFYSVSDVYHPKEPSHQGVHISKSYDATTHFETVINDVLRIYKEVTGSDLDLSSEKIKAKQEQAEEQYQ